MMKSFHIFTYSFGTLIKRIATFVDKNDYLTDLEAKSDLSDHRDEVLDRVSAVIVDVIEYRNSYENYAYLWVDDRQVIKLILAQCEGQFYCHTAKISLAYVVDNYIRSILLAYLIVFLPGIPSSVSFVWSHVDSRRGRGSRGCWSSSESPNSGSVQTAR